MLASGKNHSADAISITHPHAPAQEYLYRQLLNKSDIDANDVCYVEMHGAGTQAGDGTEMLSVTNVFADPHWKRRPDQPLHLGPFKANIGHGEAASGVSALLGGPNDEINEVAEELSRKGVKNTKLKIPFAFHISQVDSVLDSYEKIAKGVTLRPVVGIAVHLKYLLYKSRRHLACAGLNKIAWHCATDWVFMHGQSSWTKPNPIPRIIERFAAMDMIGDGGKNVSALHMLRGLEPRVPHLTPIKMTQMSTYRRAGC